MYWVLLKVKKEDFVSLIVIKGICVSVKSLGECDALHHIWARGGVRPLAPPTDCHPRIGLFAWAYLKACEGWGILLTSPLGYPDPVFPTFSIIWGALGQ